ncbi:hypothetical protein DSECCO2_602010 [anaerobic digester metagenome]
MEILVLFLKWGLPLLVITDLGSALWDNPLLLNVSRAIRILILFLFIIENIRHIGIIRKFYFAKFLFFFAIVHFFYLFTDPIFFEGIWEYSKILFWILGLNVLFAYGYKYKNELDLHDFVEIIKKIALLAFGFTILYYSTGFLDSDYNAAAYLGVFIYPLILYTSDNFKKNQIYILIIAVTVMITIKRGAILAFLLTNIIFYFWSLISLFNLKKFVLGMILIASVFFVGSYFILKQEDRIEDRFSEEQMDINNPKAGSGRVGLYTNLYTEWIESDNIIFGFGNQADSHRWGGNWRRTHAHSDIFGYLYNFGLIGISLILIFYLKIIRFYMKYRRVDSENSAIIIAFLVALFLVNLYSGLLKSTDAFYLFALLPYFQLQQEELQKNNHTYA